MTNTSGKIVWITGASSGMGEALAKKFAAEGFDVAASARSTDKLNILSQAHFAKGAIKAFPLDVTDRAATLQVIDAICQSEGGIDIAILNAGTYTPDNGDHLDIDRMEKEFNLNVFSVAQAIKILCPRMAGRKGATIAVVSSVAGYRGLPNAVTYGGTKAALINMTESLRHDLARHGISLKLICPGFVKTPLTDKNKFPMPFLISAETAADIIFRELPKSGFEIAFPWQMKLIFGLLRFLPNRTFFALTKNAAMPSAGEKK